MSNFDGGPAFPQPQSPYDKSVFEGVSIRDYFAAKAMQGFAVNAKADDESLMPLLCQQLATVAYQMADAMLAERAK